MALRIASSLIGTSRKRLSGPSPYADGAVTTKKQAAATMPIRSARILQASRPVGRAVRKIRWSRRPDKRSAVQSFLPSVVFNSEFVSITRCTTHSTTSLSACRFARWASFLPSSSATISRVEEGMRTIGQNHQPSNPSQIGHQPPHESECMLQARCFDSPV